MRIPNQYNPLPQTRNRFAIDGDILFLNERVVKMHLFKLHICVDYLGGGWSS